MGWRNGQPVKPVGNDAPEGKEVKGGMVARHDEHHHVVGMDLAVADADATKLVDTKVSFIADSNNIVNAIAIEIIGVIVDCIVISPTVGGFPISKQMR